MKYVKQMIVEAIQFTGDNQQEIINLCQGSAFLSRKNDKLVIRGPYDYIPINEGDWVVVNQDNKNISKLNNRNFHKMCKPLKEDSK